MERGADLLRIYVSCLLYAVRDNLTEASHLTSFYTLSSRGERRARGGDGQLQMVEIEGRCGEVLLTVVHVMLFSADTSRLPEQILDCRQSMSVCEFSFSSLTSGNPVIVRVDQYRGLAYHFLLLHMPMPRS
jgi:hypothetical protein